jgi:hypothetical protein
MKLYKYVSPARWRGILMDKLIRFTQPSALNDPFEMTPSFRGLADEEWLLKRLDGVSELEYQKQYQKKLIEAYAQLPDEVRPPLPVEPPPKMTDVLAMFFAIAGPALEGMMPALRQVLSENLNKHIGVLCLSEVPFNELMWSHYAEGHTGLVIEFDSDHGYFNQRRTDQDEFGHLRKVVYDDRPNILLSDVSSTDLFLFKGKPWEYEQEWRMLRPLKDYTQVETIDDTPIYLFALPPDCITGIILGARMAEGRKQEISEYLAADNQYSHVKVYSACLDEREYKLNLVPFGEGGSSQSQVK